MKRLCFLDSSDVWLVCLPPGGDGDDVRNWMIQEQANETTIVIPEIVDYEVRRELLRRQSRNILKRLDLLEKPPKKDSAILTVDYLPISTAAMRRAAELWAAARNAGQPTKGDDAWMATSFSRRRRSNIARTSTTGSSRRTTWITSLATSVPLVPGPGDRFERSGTGTWLEFVGKSAADLKAISPRVAVKHPVRYRPQPTDPRRGRVSWIRQHEPGFLELRSWGWWSSASGWGWARRAV